MKVLVFVCLVITAANAFSIPKEMREKLMTINNECMESSGVEDSLVVKAVTGEFSDDPKFKEHIVCITVKIGLMNEAGELQTDVIKQKLTEIVPDQAKIDMVLEKCMHHKDTPAETAVESLKCFYDIMHN